MGVVVTGSAGFIGRALVRHLLDLGHEVVGIDRRVAPAPRGAGHLEITADLVAGDERVTAALGDADAVVHLAGCPGVRDALPDADHRRHRDNVLATAAVFEAVPLRTHVVVSTSSSVYGGSRTGRPSAESDPLRPRGGYARSKALTERLCRERISQGGRIAIARPFTVAGENQRPDMALAVWLAAAREGRPLRILGGPDRTRDVTDVAAVADVLAEILARGVTGPINIGTGVGRRLDELVAAVGEVLDVEVRTEVVPASPDEAPATLADTRRLRRLVGFVPQTDLRDVLRRQVAAERAVADADPAGEMGRRAAG